MKWNSLNSILRPVMIKLSLLVSGLYLVKSEIETLALEECHLAQSLFSCVVATLEWLKMYTLVRN